MKSKVVVMCGSMKFLDKVQELAERLELEKGYAVITLLPHVINRNLTADEVKRLGDIHLQKIDLADAVYVVNVGGYIGQTVQREIAYAREKGKEILFFEEKMTN